VDAGDLVAAVFALQHCQTLDAKKLLNHRLGKWLKERPDITCEIANWYSESLAPIRLSDLASSHANNEHRRGRSHGQNPRHTQPQSPD
jgi:hypothetical protein